MAKSRAGILLWLPVSAGLLWLTFGGTTQGQTKGRREFVGTTKCAACHYNQYKTWKSSPHGSAFEILPEKYRRDVSCLKCHTTGFGEPSTLANATDVYVTGVNCEACHGPGSEHVKLALRLVDQEITDSAVKNLRSAIQLASLDRCIGCHQSVAHGSHPKFDQTLPPPGRNRAQSPPRSQDFFSFQSHEN